MSQAKLQAAHELIRERNFSAARAVLLTIPNDPTAKKWLTKLDEIDPLPLPSLEAVLSRPERQSTKPSSRKRSRGLVIVVLLIAIIVVSGLLIRRQSQLDAWKAKKPEANAALSVFCLFRISGMNSIECEQWVTRLLNEDISRVDVILFCESLYSEDGKMYSDDALARGFLEAI